MRTISIIPSFTYFYRILLFLKPSVRESWEKGRLRQREIPGSLGAAIDWNHYTGIQRRYPLQGNAGLCDDCFRFIDLHGNTIGDVYVYFHLHGERKTDALYLIPNNCTGGIDFTKNEKSIVNNKVQGKADLRWLPLPLPSQLVQQQTYQCKTYVVIHHPEDVCDTIVTRFVPPIATGQFHGGTPPIKPLSQEQNFFLTGGSIHLFENKFTKKIGSMIFEVNLESFFHFLCDYHAE